jgi:flagellar protein FliO/FliZ
MLMTVFSRLSRLLLVLVLLWGQPVVAADTEQPAQVGLTDEKKTVQTTVAVAEPPPLFTSPISAKKPVPATGSAVVTSDPFTIIFALLFIVLLIFFVAWLMRRVGAIPIANGQAMKVVAGLSVGTREKVILLDVGGEQLLIGVAPGRISHLHSFEQPVVNPDSIPVSEFSLKLKKLLQGDKLREDKSQSGNRKGVEQ